VLFELLTGSAPYRGDSAMAVAYQHVNSDVPAPSSRRAGIAPQLDELVLRATCREPAGRPLDAGALLAELHNARIDLGLPVVGVPPRPQMANPTQDTQRIARLPEPGSGMSSSAMSATSMSATAMWNTAPTAAGPAAPDLHHTTVQDRGPVAPAGDSRRRGGSTAIPAAVRRRRSRRRSIVVVAVVLLLGLMTAFGAWYLAVGRYHAVPDVAGDSRETAVQELRGAGFDVDSVIDQAYSETGPAGTVLGSRPDAGSHLLSGHSVRLVISRGPERFVVPPVAGQDYTAAEQAFAGIPVHLVRRDIADPTGKIAPGQVIRTVPGPTAKVKRDSAVTVFVSTGPPIVAVPDVVNKPQDEASTTLTKAGFKVDVSQDYSDTVAAGSVISEDPAAKSPVAKFSTVKLVISRGPPLVTLPQIRNGTPLIIAQHRLEGLGLKVRVKRAFGGFLDTVVGMDPGAGTEVRLGSEVVLTVV
jgi:serine/threonine-protein kinase